MKRLSFLLLAILILVSITACGGENASEKGEGDSSANGSSDDAVVGYLNGKPILHSETHELIAGELAKAEVQIYNLKRRAVQQIAMNRILEDVAAGQGKTKEQLVRDEVVSRMPEISDDNLRQAYEAYKTRDPNLANRSFDEAKGYLQQQIQAQAMTDIRDQYLASLLEGNDVKITIDPPRADVPIPAYEPRKGDESAPITIVEFADYECGFCRRLHPEMQNVLNEYGDKVQFVYRDFPLEMHDKAEPASIAARCAGDQGKYWEYHDDLMTNVNAGNLERQDLIDRASKVGVDVAAFTTCIDAETHKEKVEEGLEDGKALGVGSTPTLFVNGIRVIGYKNAEFLKDMIDEELERLGLSAEAEDSSDSGDAAGD